MKENIRKDMTDEENIDKKTKEKILLEKYNEMENYILCNINQEKVWNYVISNVNFFEVMNISLTVI